ncbi:hypothetical protein [Ensifer adhaerens]|uniref:hypothetical protein n=1 Tax=Ensifer adhaerens TaxID=106592 RepID=UPI00131A0EDF|nr:hypothetical protein [Ensifer adhaerens]
MQVAVFVSFHDERPVAWDESHLVGAAAGTSLWQFALALPAIFDLKYASSLEFCRKNYLQKTSALDRRAKIVSK